MTSQLQPIKVWGAAGPNPPKVAMILAELDVPYEVINWPFSDVKKPEYVAINPNGRLPAIRDPNTGITLWESGAIVEYLIERYDTEKRLSFAPGTPESYHAKQWLFFQTTGQGPMYGQAVWFKKFHHEQLDSAKERYNKEIGRIAGVLDAFLAQQKEQYGSQAGFDGPWLVGNKLSYADISFVAWQNVIQMILSKDEFDLDNYPVMKEWMDKMLAREKVQKVFKAALAAMSS